MDNFPSKKYYLQSLLFYDLRSALLENGGAASPEYAVYFRKNKTFHKYIALKNGRVSATPTHRQ